ncbi:MAG: hypothetical protein COW55_11430 [Rhodobacteraceae bacterium CG17_big_fil_post_rev_8_21_14_2_50_65_11]|nr:MAG: hypothetical protein COW55_11430 [Rhodobacteraceae bacterium CG17_big_fil_post_rev_8_21_14_2_50_65_11]
MILTALAGGVFGLYLLVRGDGPARFVGILLIIAAALFGFLFWVAIYVDLPPHEAARSLLTEVGHV